MLAVLHRTSQRPLDLGRLAGTEKTVTHSCVPHCVNVPFLHFLRMLQAAGQAALGPAPPGLPCLIPRSSTLHWQRDAMVTRCGTSQLELRNAPNVASSGEHGEQALNTAVLPSILV